MSVVPIFELRIILLFQSGSSRGVCILNGMFLL